MSAKVAQLGQGRKRRNATVRKGRQGLVADQIMRLGIGYLLGMNSQADVPARASNLGEHEPA
jgi:hypothetical protein